MAEEKNVENKIKNKLKKSDYYFYKNFASPYTSKGIPDIVGVGNNKFFALEVKSSKNSKPSPVQIRHLLQIAKNGGLSFITSNTNVIDNIDNPDKIYPHTSIIEIDEDTDINAAFATKLWTNREKHIDNIKIKSKGV